MNSKQSNLLKLYFENGKLEAGLDESGAGPLCGPVYAAAVIWPSDSDYFLQFPEFDIETDPEAAIDVKEYEPYKLLVTKGDSKKLTENQRNLVREFVEDYSIAYSVSSCSAAEIDRMNILNARIEAMHRAVRSLSVKPEKLLVDGSQFKIYVDPGSFEEIPYHLFEKGDSRYVSIAAASVLAKTHRDELMQELHMKYPVYGWDHNKGYGTSAHYCALREHGPCPEHRRSFNLHLN